MRWDTVEDLKRDLKEGAYVNAQDEESSTPLHWAVQERDLELMAELLDARAYVNARDDYNITPLHYAARWGAPAIEQLVTVGADMDAQDERGATPLHWAVGCENLEAIAALRDAGATLDVQDEEGQTPMAWAKGGRRTDAAGEMIRDKVIEALQEGPGTFLPRRRMDDLLEEELYELGSLRRDACKLTALADGRYKTAGTFHCVYRGIHICRVEEIFGREHVLYLVETAPQTTFRGTEEAKEEINRFWRRWEGTNLAMKTQETHDARMGGTDAKMEHA